MTYFLTSNTSVQHFSDGYTQVEFFRPVNTLIITNTSGGKISFDGGLQYLTLQAASTLTFYHLHQRKIDIQGTAHGIGIAI